MKLLNVEEKGGALPDVYGLTFSRHGDCIPWRGPVEPGVCLMNETFYHLQSGEADRRSSTKALHIFQLSYPIIKETGGFFTQKAEWRICRWITHTLEVRPTHNQAAPSGTWSPHQPDLTQWVLEEGVRCFCNEEKWRPMQFFKLFFLSAKYFLRDQNYHWNILTYSFI